MNRNLTTVTFTLVVLGLLATFDIIPGAGFYAGIVMLAIGVTAFTVQLIGREHALARAKGEPKEGPSRAREPDYDEIDPPEPRRSPACVDRARIGRVPPARERARACKIVG